MTHHDDPEFRDWVQRARDVPIMEVVSALQIPLKKAGTEWVGPCPTCGGTDRFAVNEKDGVFNCRSFGGGDAIKMAMHVQNLAFVPACEWILNEPPPRSNSTIEPKPIDHDREKQIAERQRDDEIARQIRDAAERAKKKTRAQEVFESGVDISGTLAAVYLKARGLVPMPEQREFLRFIPRHPYFNGADENGRPIKIGEWPAMVTLMRDAHGVGDCLHCTYLNPDGLTKLDHSIEGSDGRPMRLNPRKMYGTKGLIWLSPPQPFMVIGEGIETVLSYLELNIERAEFGIAAAGDLGNMCGGAMETRPHPRKLKQTIPWGEPDPDKPGFPVPGGTKEILFLGDADGDEANVRAHLLIAGRRHLAAGLTVSIGMARRPANEKKWDWNDELRLWLRTKDAAAA